MGRDCYGLSLLWAVSSRNWVDDRSAQCLFAISISVWKYIMIQKYTKFIHFALHLTIVPFNLIAL